MKRRRAKVIASVIKGINPTLHVKIRDIRSLPFIAEALTKNLECSSKKLITFSKNDWDTRESSWDFKKNPLLSSEYQHRTISDLYDNWQVHNQNTINEILTIEKDINRIFIDTYGLQDELTSEVPIEQITLTINPAYRYGAGKTEAEYENLFQNDTLKELTSYAIGCMMGRYSLDREGLVYAHAANEGFTDLVIEGAYQTFPADDDGIIPLTDQEWFKDDATNRFREFVKTVWGEEHLQENLDFVAESLCLYAIKPKKGEAALATIRRYLSSQFYKDHLKTYKKRPIYWLFSSGKQKAFECLVYLHRYNEGTLARMRTEYVTPLLGKYEAYLDQLENQIDHASSTSDANRLKKERDALTKKQVELRSFDDKLKHYADRRISLDLDDGVKVNYGKFGDLLSDVKAITGNAPENH